MIKFPGKYFIKDIPRLLRDAFRELLKNDPLRMAGATAFFTSFALAPILIILIQALGLFFDPQRISHLLFRRLAGIIGRESVHQIVSTLTAFRKMAQNWFITIGGFFFLVFISTTLFKVIKSSINQLWKIRVVKKRNVFVRFRTRIQSVFVILVTGVLFIAGLILQTAQAFLGKYIFEFSPALNNYFNSFLNVIVSLIIVTLWFALLFRFLPDGRPAWKITFGGGFLTSLLFNIGKLVLRSLLQHSNINTVYGASGSIVLLLLFVFYSALILYYGAAFTKIWGAYLNSPIRPLSHAIHYKLAEVDENDVTAVEGNMPAFDSHEQQQ